MRTVLNLLLALMVFGLTPVSLQAAPKKSNGVKTAKQSHAGPVEDDEDDDDVDKFDRPGLHEEDDGGDPYPRYAEASSKDGNCDPTFLRDLYQNFANITCRASLKTGVCFNPEETQLYWGLGAGGGGAALTFYGWEVGSIKYSQNYLRTKPFADKVELTAKELVELEKLNAKFIEGSRELRWATHGKIAGKSLIKGGLAGALLTGAWTFAYSDLWPQTKELVLGATLNKEACSTEERDPEFRKYVPVQTGTCKTPLYEVGNPKVSAFLELPLRDKLKALENKLTCGYYKSLNVELVKRNGMEEGRTQIEKVRCDQTSGAITFQIKSHEKAIDTNSFTIKRKPETQEFESYSFERSIGDTIQEGAFFDLAKKEDDIQLITTRILHRPSGSYRSIATAKIPAYQNEDPLRARIIFGAFRTVRKFSRNLAMCCDLDPPTAPTDLEKSDKKKRSNVKKRFKQIAAYQKLCPKEWFSSTPRAQLQSKPKTAR